MSNSPFKPISIKEHLLHVILTLITSGFWLIVYLIRVFLKQREIRKLTPEQKSEIKSKIKAGYEKRGKSKKEEIMEAVERLNSTLPPNKELGQYHKRYFANEEERELDEWADFSEDYSFELVGESNYRETLLALIKKNDAFKLGELFVDAVIKQEPENEFDSTAVAVLVAGKKVAYVPSSMSLDVTSYLDEKGFNAMKVKAVLKWDSESPQPNVGVWLDFNF